MTPGNDGVTPAVALQDTPKLPAALPEPEPQPRRCQPPYRVTLRDNPLHSNGTWSSAAPQGSARLEQGVTESRTRGLSLAAWCPTPAQGCGSGDISTHSPGTRRAFVVNPVCWTGTRHCSATHQRTLLSRQWPMELEGCLGLKEQCRLPRLGSPPAPGCAHSSVAVFLACSLPRTQLNGRKALQRV